MRIIPPQDIGPQQSIIKRYAIISIVFFILFFGCEESGSSTSFIKIETEHTKLIDGIESYQNIANFKAFLKQSSLQWEITGDKKSPSDNRPPFHIYEITIKNYSHYSFLGELQVSFFNDRLVDTTFYPLEFDRYKNALEKEEGIQFDDKQKVKIPPFTEVYIASDHKKNKYVRWEDTRLANEFNLWIKRYS